MGLYGLAWYLIVLYGLIWSFMAKSNLIRLDSSFLEVKDPNSFCLVPFRDGFTCANVCGSSGNSCENFIDTPARTNCEVIPEDNIDSLVKTSEKSLRRSHVWLKKPFQPKGTCNKNKTFKPDIF